ncbi:MAG TPA: hypothetical protein EYP77_10055 [Anaerolineae bacterium]|nr:hypothetical protein [Anaerolineae bacterium]
MPFRLVPEDDHRHTLEPGEHEAFYFQFTSPDGSVFGFIRTLFDREGILELVALRAGGRAWSHQQRAPLSDAPATDASGPSLRLTCLEPWRAWRCLFQGAVQGVKGGMAAEAVLNLTFTASGDPTPYRFGPYQQVQQDGRLDGRLRVGPETWTGGLLCSRDRSWGRRPMGAATGWTVVSVPGHLYVAVVQTEGGTVCFGQFTPPDGQRVPARAARVSPEGDGCVIEDREAGVGAWRARRLAPPLVAHLGPAGQEALRDEPRPGDLLRDEIGPALFTSPEGEEVVGFLEQARRLV